MCDTSALLSGCQVGQPGQLFRADPGAGLITAFFSDWDPLRNLSQPGSLDFSYYRSFTLVRLTGWDTSLASCQTDAVSLLDTAPTVARVLDITPHPDWEGRCVKEVFD